MNLPLWLKSSLIRNTSWMLVSEAMSRATRLVTVIALAAYLSSAEFGTAMLALACHELLRVLLRSGAGPKVIQCAENDLPVIASNGASLQWIVCISLCAIQFFSAPYVSLFYKNEQLTLLLQIMAFSYLLYPLVSVHVFMLQRTNQMRFFSLGSGACVMVENLGCAFLLACGCGLASVAYTKIMAALAWVCCFYFAPVKHFGVRFNPTVIVQLGRYSGSILGIETLRTLRTQLDVVIAGRLLSPELLGIYSFAKSAGVGLSQSLSAAYLSALYPHICKQERHTSASCKQAPIYRLSTAIAFLFLVQAIVAPYYIQWFFAEQWHDSTLLVSLLCLSAIPALFVDTECSFLRARSQVNRELILCGLCVVMSATSLMLINPLTPMDFAKTVAFTSVFWLVIYFHRAFNVSTILVKRICV